MNQFSILEFLFPTKCIFCSTILPHQNPQICPKCCESLPTISKVHRKIPFSCGATALWRYDGNVRNSLLRYKFRRKRHYANFYSLALAEKLSTQRDSFDMITWVPVSRMRKFRRGYDQGEVLSRLLGQELGIDVIQCLRKRKHNPPQSTIKGEAQRRANVLGVYEPILQVNFTGKRILLIDDIITTGATIGECAKTLITYGAKSVYCAAVAASTNHK